MKLPFLKKLPVVKTHEKHKKYSNSSKHRRRRSSSGQHHSEFKCYNQDLVPYNNSVSYDRISNQYFMDNNLQNYNNNLYKYGYGDINNSYYNQQQQQQCHSINDGKFINFNSLPIVRRSINNFQFDGLNILTNNSHQTVNSLVYKKRRRKVSYKYIVFFFQ